MQVSLNWLKDYIDIDLTAQEISEILTAIGLEVEGVKELKSGPDLQGVVVGHVLTTEQHPNADRLKVTTVDIGTGEPIQVVCGAPNVAQGQKVLVATVGTILPSEGEKIFKIKKGKIRGEVSEGMICADDELGIGTDHDGIKVLDDQAVVGTDAETYLAFESDVVFDIGLTPNRSDATSHLGVAADIKAYLNYNKAYKKELNRPDVSAYQEGTGTPITVVVEDHQACPRYTGVLIENIKIGPAPDWIKSRLQSIGIKSINNVVDITNFILHEIGQPLHAFDADKIKDNKIIVKQLPSGTKFQTLDENERTLDAEDLMICDGENNGLCIAGVYGGNGSGVVDSTTRIFLESAHFDASSLRRTSFRHLLRTDAAMVYEKGSDPNITEYALKRAVLLMQEYAGATVGSEIIDIYPTVIEPAIVDLNLSRVKTVMGVDISNIEITKILTALEIDIVEQTDDSMRVKIPTNKSDVTREVDVIEELLRIYGFDHVALPGYIQAAIPQSQPVNRFKVRNTIADMLTGSGFSEMMALSIVEHKYFEQDDDSLIRINNTSNTNLDVMRPHLVYSAMEASAYNLNRQQTRINLFENGRSYAKKEDKLVEKNELALLMIGTKYEESWATGERRLVNFYDLKSEVHLVLNKLGLNSFQTSELDSPYYEYGLTYHRGPNKIVELGLVSDKIAKQFGVRKDAYLAVFDWDVIFRFYKNDAISVEEITKFPAMRRDLALVVDKNVQMGDVERIAFKTDKKILKELNLFDVYVNEDQLGKAKKSYAVSFIFENKEKTLQDKEVNQIMDKMISRYEKDLGALIRK